MSTSGREIRGVTFAAGQGGGEALVLTAPVSLWGGVDAATGELIEHGHPQVGASLRDKVVIMPGTHGSNGGSSIMLELVRAGVHPAAWVLERESQILLTGVIVARELYDVSVPMVVVSRAAVETFVDGMRADVVAGPDGAVIRLV